VKFITAIAFVKNGKFAVVGTYNGRCFFYSTDQLKYHTVVDVRSSRGKNARGHKVTGLAVHGDKLLVTSNDSRIRMYDVRDKALTCKFRGAQNEHSQIRAAFSPDGRHIVCGSEDNHLLFSRFIYFWRTSDLPSTLSVRKDRNAMWERIRVHSAPVSVAVFAPKPNVYLSMFNKQDEESRDSSLFSTTQQVCAVHVIVSADLQGTIKIMVNKSKASKTGMLRALSSVKHLLSHHKASLLRRSLTTGGLDNKQSFSNETNNGVDIPQDAGIGHIDTSTMTMRKYSKNALTLLKLDEYPFYVEREWWKRGKRMTFWATWRQLRDVNRREHVAKSGADRMRLKALKWNTVLPQAIRDAAADELHSMPKYTIPKLVLNMCMFTGRKRGKIKPYRLNRHLFRKLADHSKLSGVQRAMW
ncbi:ribosomal protein S14p/S29e, partial [Dictyocaulus viviparus]